MPVTYRWVTMPNLVALGQTVSAYVGHSRKSDSAMVSPFRGVFDP